MVKKKRSETAVILVSDLQFGRVSPTYSPEEGLATLEKVRDAIIDIKTDHLRNYIFDQLVIVYLGDIVDGDCIFPGHAWELKIGAADQIMALSEWIDDNFHKPLKDAFGKITLVGVPGNHGRPTPRPGQTTARTNYDLMLYNNFSLLHKRSNGVKCSFDYKVALEKTPDGKYSVKADTGYVYIKGYKVRGWKMLLYHGHGIVSWAGVPFYGIVNRVKSWSLSFGEFNIFCMGDKHVAWSWPLSHRLEIFLNGTALTGDEWAMQRIGMPAGQTWWFFGVSDKRPVSFRYAIPTTEEKPFEFIPLNGE